MNTSCLVPVDETLTYGLLCCARIKSNLHTRPINLTVEEVKKKEGLEYKHKGKS